MALDSSCEDKDVFCHPLSSTFFSNGSCLDALEEQYGKANIDGRAITNDGVDALAEEEHELEAQAAQLITKVPMESTGRSR